MVILIFIITILILVVIHELGHFFAAKKFNIKVLEFGFGIPPRIFGKMWGETLISLNWLPFGGFVKLLGEDDDDPKALKNKRSFAAQDVWPRIVVVIGGVTMNLVMAWILLWVLLGMQNFKVQVPLFTEHRFTGVTQTDETVVLVTSVGKDSPAEQAGLKPGDRIIALNKQPIKDSDELISLVKLQAGNKIQLTISDNNKSSLREVLLAPRLNPPPGQGAMGVSLNSIRLASLSYDAWWQKILSGPIHSLNLTTYSFEVLGQTITKALATKDIAPVRQTVAGPVGITSLLGSILEIKNPLLPYLEFLAVLSLNLAIINVLPFPGLDGGRLVFLLFEAFTSKKVSPTIERYVHSVGLAVLIGLILLITISDINKFF